jgi:3',5'-cyclic AMP phosphodiesterase CpdA
VALILHLSDVHLVSPGSDAADEVGDYSKSRLVEPIDRQNRKALLEDTLSALASWLEKRDQDLDAIVVTGDVALRGRKEGYDLLPSLLARLGSKLPPTDRVMVVPGNHDVALNSPPGSHERYQAFAAAIDAAGYRRPALEGYDDFGAHNPLLLGTDKSYLVVGINSANWSVAREPLSEEAEEQLQELITAGVLPDQLASEIAALRLYDAARISRDQMIKVADALRSAVTMPDRRPVRIAALHHQLFPVSPTEEVKPFETMTNLAEFRNFLADNRVDVVLHGHKHVPHIYHHDLSIGGLTQSPTGSLHRLLVCSAGTVGGTISHGAEVAKLIEIDAALPDLPKITVHSLPAGGPAGQLTLAPSTSVARRLSGPIVPAGTPGTVVSGQTVRDVHMKLLAHFADRADRPDLHLMCVILEGPSALARPSTYPPVGEDDSDAAQDAWFADLVEWWQNRVVAEGKPFTHGQRIRSWGDVVRRDQLSEVVDALAHDITSSRGLVVLYDPAKDHIATAAEKFPAFVLAQFHVHDGALHVVGVFRKQEMRYWWPINAAELARMQDTVVTLLAQREKTVRPGSITTFTTQARASQVTPRVAVPRIDRLVYDDPATLWAMAVAVLAADMPERGRLLLQLVNLMRDWEPTDVQAPDGSPVPGPGLVLLRDALRRLGPEYGADLGATAVASIVDQMITSNDLYRGRDDATGDDYVTWRNRSREYLTQLDRALNDLMQSIDCTS